MNESKKLRRRLITAALALLAALFSVTAATFAWYIYNTSARTTKVEMAAGSSVSLEISSEKDKGFASATVMEDFTGLLEPVSTDRIYPDAGTPDAPFYGFRRATFFEAENPGTDRERLFAAAFDNSTPKVDYHKTSLFLRTNAPTLDIYVSDIGYEDADDQRPLSTALRVGLVVKQKEEDGNYPEYIFAINTAEDANRIRDNADRVPLPNRALDSSKTDGTTVELIPLNSSNYCNYDSATGSVSLKDNSRALFTLMGGENGGYGQPVEVEVYLWLEGCDLDCTSNLMGQTLKNLTLSFAGYAGEGA